MITPSHFTRGLFTYVPNMVENMVSDLSEFLWSNMLDGIFSTLKADYFNYLPGLPRPSQKGKRCKQYELGVALSRTL